MRVLKGFLNEDDIRIIRVLLTKTEVTVHFAKTSSRSAVLKCGPQDFFDSRSFLTNVGTPQNDSFSPLLFVIYLEAALRELRSLYEGPITKIIYADDVDIVSTDNCTWETWRMVPNYEHGQSRRCRCITFRNPSHENMESVEEAWLTAWRPGGYNAQKNSGYAALKTVIKDWLQCCPVYPSLRSRIYNEFVKPILMYNSSTFPIPN
ncbi:uncharacterized protein LOC115232100 [Octopus sinensis]|uniref:Uncharacterized protein LOC115232100 n=1 Tax=Octopus sinensis TaxID=2607531 RepID=A0A6P7U649_9MOLL|nr:uncharacterized protein LOC115232100 [Octopus sinensis]